MTKTCTQCRFTGEPSLFVSGRNKCKACRSKQEAERQRLANQTTLVVKPCKPAKAAPVTKVAPEPEPSQSPATATSTARVPLVLATPRKVAKPRKTERISLENRDSMDVYVRAELSNSLEHYDQIISDNTARVTAAYDSGNSKAIDEATKAYQKSVDAKSAVLANLMERLKLLDDLRAKSEKTKPVTFRFVALTEDRLPEIVASRTVPSE